MAVRPVATAFRKPHRVAHLLHVRVELHWKILKLEDVRAPLVLLAKYVRRLRHKVAIFKIFCTSNDSLERVLQIIVQTLLCAWLMLVKRGIARILTRLLITGHVESVSVF